MTASADKELACLNADKDTREITRKNNSHPAAYALHHVATDKLYVGSTEDLYVRVNKHRTSLMAGEHRNRNMQAAFDLDPRFSLGFVKTETKEEALEIEQRLLDSLASTGRLLNIATNAEKPNLGVVYDEQRKAELRENTLTQFANEEARRRHSEISKEKWKDPEYLKKRLAQEYTDEMRANNSAATKEKWKDPEYRDKLHHSRRGKPVIVDGVEYPSLNNASEVLGLSYSGLRSRLNKGNC